MIGTSENCPYIAGGRSSRGPLKTGSTVYGKYMVVEKEGFGAFKNINMLLFWLLSLTHRLCLYKLFLYVFMYVRNVRSLAAVGSRFRG